MKMHFFLNVAGKSPFDEPYSGPRINRIPSEDSRFMKNCNQAKGKKNLTINPVDIIGPRASLAIPTLIGWSVLPVSHMGPGSSSTPSLVLHPKDFEALHRCVECAFLEGFRSSAIISGEQGSATVYPWDCTASGVFEAADSSNCVRKESEFVQI